MFTEEDLDLFLQEFGCELPVTLNGVPVKPVLGIPRYEVVEESADQAEIGSSVLTIQVKKSDYDAQDKTKKYAYTYQNLDYKQRGPAIQDGSGFVKLILTQVK